MPLYQKSSILSCRKKFCYSATRFDGFNNIVVTAVFFNLTALVLLPPYMDGLFLFTAGNISIMADAFLLCFGALLMVDYHHHCKAIGFAVVT